MMPIQRDLSIDILKGIGIILVICAHVNTIPFDYPLKKAIYAFHMPLFFIISGYFYRKKNIAKNFKKDIRRLVIPLVISLSICSLLAIPLLFDEGVSSFLSKIFGLWTLINPGPVWFLASLFICKNIYNILDNVVDNNIYTNILDA